MKETKGSKIDRKMVNGREENYPRSDAMAGQSFLLRACNQAGYIPLETMAKWLFLILRAQNAFPVDLPGQGSPPPLGAGLVHFRVKYL